MSNRELCHKTKARASLMSTSFSMESAWTCNNLVAAQGQICVCEAKARFSDIQHIPASLPTSIPRLQDLTSLIQAISDDNTTPIRRDERTLRTPHCSRLGQRDTSIAIRPPLSSLQEVLYMRHGICEETSRPILHVRQHMPVHQC